MPSHRIAGGARFPLTNDNRSPVARATKSELRRSVRVRIAEMSRPERDRADEAVSRNLLTLASELEVSFAVAYFSLPDEACVDLFLAAMVERGIPTMLPSVRTDGAIALGFWRPASRLVCDKEGVPAPPAGKSWPSGRGLLVVPGRVFDTEGGRVGRGRGHYDRFLAAGRGHAFVVGAAYECQVVERVPREVHDIGVDGLATEKGCRRFPGSARN